MATNRIIADLRRAIKADGRTLYRIALDAGLHYEILRRVAIGARSDVTLGTAEQIAGSVGYRLDLVRTSADCGKPGRAVPTDYRALLAEFPPRPIRNAADYDRTAAAMDRLAIRPEGSLSVGERDYLDLLTLLIQTYDARHFDSGQRARPTPTARNRKGR